MAEGLNWHVEHQVLAPCPGKTSKPGHKNTTRWCKGKVGREHVVTHVSWKGNYGRMDVQQDVCQVCGKVLAWHLPPRRGRII